MKFVIRLRGACGRNEGLDICLNFYTVIVAAYENYCGYGEMFVMLTAHWAGNLKITNL